MAAILAVFFMSIHLADDVARNEMGNLTGAFATFVIIILVTWLYGLSLIVRQKSRYGYLISLLAALYVTIVGLIHTTGFGGVSVTEIAQTTGVFFVWIVIAMSVSSIPALLLSLYGLLRAQK